MRALVQRVSSASVSVEGRRVSSIGAGLLVLLGVMRGDTDGDLEYMVRKTARLRIFEDDEGRMGRSVMDTGGEVLVVSQFTLAADARKGNRPSFASAEAQPQAEAVYEKFMHELAALGLEVKGGRFGAMMQVGLVNDGPVTIMLDSRPG